MQLAGNWHSAIMSTSSLGSSSLLWPVCPGWPPLFLPLGCRLLVCFFKLFDGGNDEFDELTFKRSLSCAFSSFSCLFSISSLSKRVDNSSTLASNKRISWWHSSMVLGSGFIIYLQPFITTPSQLYANSTSFCKFLMHIIKEAVTAVQKLGTTLSCYLSILVIVLTGHIL